MIYQPQHLPNGTQVTLDLVGGGRDTDTVYTVKGLVRNGIRSYVFKTGKMREGREIEEAFNTSYINKIVKRGDGPVEVNHGYYGAQFNPRHREEVDMMRYNVPTEGWKPRKGFHNTGSFQAVLFNEVNRIAKPGMSIDYTKVGQAVLSQTWAHRPLFENTFVHVWCFNKKRLRKFLKTNLNRFLCKLDVAVAEEEEAERISYERDTDDYSARTESWEDEVTPKEEKEIGSYFMPEDYVQQGGTPCLNMIY